MTKESYLSKINPQAEQAEDLLELYVTARLV